MILSLSVIQWNCRSVLSSLVDLHLVIQVVIPFPRSSFIQSFHSSHPLIASRHHRHHQPSTGPSCHDPWPIAPCYAPLRRKTKKKKKARADAFHNLSRDSFDAFLECDDLDFRDLKWAFAVLCLLCSHCDRGSPRLQDLLRKTATSENFARKTLPKFAFEVSSLEDCSQQLESLVHLLDVLEAIKKFVLNTDTFLSLLPYTMAMVDSLRESQLGIDDIYNRAVKLEALATSGAMLGGQRVLSHPDFRTLPVVPASEELLARELPHLTPNRVRGSYNSTENYLNVQFRLLREDFVRPLREGIRECARAQQVRGHRYRKEIFRKLDGVNVHSGVVVISSSVNADGRVYVVQFDASSFSKIRWKETRRFIPGSLLCFSKDNFETIQVATVSRASQSMLGRGVVEVTFWNCSCEVTGQFVVLESIAYFEGYRHVFQALQNTHVLPLPKAHRRCGIRRFPSKLREQSLREQT
ncbi:NFX1-type zinc finger-containing protein 1-like [Ornithodoros turicata]|uniref:NFX1-type zinc finger-containing protein 1-like n=1 Tax=Ornithodoros turicata TaxID=34597 RepID=UPI0031395F5C